LNNYPDIKLFAIKKNRSEWLRKLTNRQRNTSCNQNLGRRRTKKEKIRAKSAHRTAKQEVVLLKKKRKNQNLKGTQNL